MIPSPSNRLLNSLSPESYKLITAHAISIDLPLRKVLYSPEKRPPFAYFPTSGFASIVTSTLDGGTAEVGLIGNEGVVGAFHVIGPAKISTECFIQSKGTALRVPLPELRNAYLQSPEIRNRILEFVQEHSLVCAQIAGCNRLHEAEARLARWLLMARDHRHSDKLDLTQDFLGMMLGTRRTTVSLVAGVLQRSGLIEISRGTIHILDPEGLQRAACDCYPITLDLITNLYSSSDWSSW